MLASPEGWGWTLDEDSNSWVPVWNMLPVVSKACSELVKCSCKIQSGCGAIENVDVVRMQKGKLKMH